MVIGPRYLLASACATTMAVGPSAAPMIAMDAASLSPKPNSVAKSSVMKMPNCAAPPSKNSFGLESSGPKSIIAPMPMNSNIGIASDASMPISNIQSMMPAVSPSLTTLERGILTRIAPKPIGSNSDGSMSNLIARKINNAPTAHITTFCHDTLAMLSIKKSI